MVSRDAFGGLMFAAFHAKKIFSGHSCYDQPIFNSLHCFYPIKTTHHIVASTACFAIL